jgi:pyridoxal phosphate enzyme (YggS family)
VSTLEANLGNVQQRITAAAERAGRNPGEVTLVAVTKTQPPGVIRAAYDLGLRSFGENRVEEAEAKIAELPDDIEWHMIGHIQSRKASRVVRQFRFIHSVDSVKLARRLDRTCADLGLRSPVLLEVNVSGEISKFGFSAFGWDRDAGVHASLLAAVAEIASLQHLEVQGLMTMAPIVAAPEEARPVFVALRALRGRLADSFTQIDWRHLSMGMTDDFEIAIEEGATLIRVGRAIFSPDLPAWRKG